MDDDLGQDLTGVLTEAERDALFAALTADDIAAANELFALAESRAPEAAGHNPGGNERELRKYWLHGLGGTKIRWHMKGAFERCVAEVSATGAGERLTDVKGYCASLYNAANGRWPGHERKKGRRRVTKEAMIAGKWSYGDAEDMVRDALKERIRALTGKVGYVWCTVVDLTDTDVVYSDDLDGDDMWQCSYTMTDAGAVTLGDATRVVRTYTPAPTGMPPDDDAPGQPGAADDLPTAWEAHTELGRILEARGAAADGGRRFAVQIIKAGRSKNLRDYPQQVLEAAAPLYEGAQVFDGHRSDDQMRTSAVAGLVGYLTGVTSSARGLEGELTVLPSAARVAEAFDAALSLESRSEPLVGLSHDVMARFRTVQEGGQTIHEATEITSVNSVDVVAVPAAGGRATRVLAGGEDPINDPAQGGGNTQEEDVPVTKADVLGVLKEATDDELSAVGLARAGTKTTESDKPADDKPEPVREVETVLRDSIMGKFLIEKAAEAAKLPAAAVDRIVRALPERISEADVAAQIGLAQDIMAAVEPVPAGRAPVGQVTQEALETKIAALDAFFEPGNNKGYRSFREAFIDVTGQAPKSFGEDFNRTILRESFGPTLYDSARSTESLTSSSWDQILGDSITRRMVAEYSRTSLQTWRQIVSNVFPVNDFRTQRVDRLGGYGTLPAVNQGQPYEPLTSPSDEEATYAITKRGGTEDITFEMIANDDIRSIQRIPVKLGLAAAQTLYRFVWDILPTNAATSYDSVTLFHTSSHGANSAAAALSTTAVEAGRVKMRQQAGYGDTSDVLSIVPKFLVVPSALEPLAWQICTSAVAIPSGAPVGAASNTPNLHQGMTPLVIDYYSDSNDWYMVADPTMVPTIEVGFYGGREDPELFTQSDPSVGSMFNSDVLTFKIRHIYSGTVIDHRGFYRGTQ